MDFKKIISTIDRIETEKRPVLTEAKKAEKPVAKPQQKSVTPAPKKKPVKAKDAKVDEGKFKDADIDKQDADEKKKSKAKDAKVDEASDAQKAAQDNFKKMISKKKGDKKDEPEEDTDEKVDEATEQKTFTVKYRKTGAGGEASKKIKAANAKEAKAKFRQDNKGKYHDILGCTEIKDEKVDEDCGKNAPKKAAKKPVKESIEPVLSFKDMIKLVVESGGQQQIDPVDEALFAWASRVAAVKCQESQKQELYAGLLYERNGGIFKLHDVLSEGGSAGDKSSSKYKKGCSGKCGELPYQCKCSDEDKVDTLAPTKSARRTTLQTRAQRMAR